MYKGKVIEVKRHFNMVEMAQEDPEVQAWLGQSFRGIGPYFKDKATATGLTFEEQRILLPTVLGIEASDKDFRKTVTKFYDEFVTPVPKTGLKLQVSLVDDSKPLSAENPPQNILDFLRYRHIIGHRDVAMDQDEAKQIYYKRYYIVDPDGVHREALAINELEDKAYVVYSKYKDSAIKVDQILTMLGIDVRQMKPDVKVLRLKDCAKRDMNMSETEQKEAFNKFIKIAEDKDLEYKYLIQEMIGHQYLQRVGNNIIYAESGKKVGDNMEDAVLYFKNPKNSRELNLLKAEYQTKSKKGNWSDYLPKEDPIPTKAE